MNVNKWLAEATRRLAEAGTGTARLDALVLLEDVTGRDRAWLLANPRHVLAAAERAKLNKLLKRRAEHTPLAYVRGHSEFYGRNFLITPAVLEPRPESETMIDLLKSLAESGKLGSKTTKTESETVKIADVGAGSGALGITAFLELEEALGAEIELLEIDSAALEVAKMNVEKHTTNISVIRSDLLAKSAGDYDVLLCNLPYVPDDHTVNRAALHEPKLAIFGGPDGLNVYRRLLVQVKKLQNKPLYILCESLPPQHKALEQIAGAAGYALITTRDFIQLFTLKGR